LIRKLNPEPSIHLPRSSLIRKLNPKPSIHLPGLPAYNVRFKRYTTRRQQTTFHEFPLYTVYSREHTEARTITKLLQRRSMLIHSLPINSSVSFRFFGLSRGLHVLSMIIVLWITVARDTRICC